MCGYDILNGNMNEVIREKVGPAPIEDKTRKTRLWWFGHVKMRSVKIPMNRCEMIHILNCRRG